MNDYLSGLENDFLNFLKMSGFQLVDYTCQGEIWVKENITVLVNISVDGKVVIKDKTDNILSEYSIYDALTDSCVADGVIGNAKKYIANVVSMLCTPSCEKEKDGRIVDLCNKVICTPLDYDGNFAEVAYCVFCGEDTFIHEFESMPHKEDCAVLLAKEILKNYE